MSEQAKEVQYFCVGFGTSPAIVGTVTPAVEYFYFDLGFPSPLPVLHFNFPKGT